MKHFMYTFPMKSLGTPVCRLLVLIVENLKQPVLSTLSLEKKPITVQHMHDEYLGQLKQRTIKTKENNLELFRREGEFFSK